jgi:hypothetical protein
MISADLQSGGVPELAFPTQIGNFYSYGNKRTFGFPLNSGQQRSGVSGSSAVYFTDGDVGKLAYVGGDGWLYMWNVDADDTPLWPMNGGDPAGTFALKQASLVAPKALASGFDDSRYYNYPNPVTDGRTTIRYYLGEQTTSVDLTIYDMSGKEITTITGTTISPGDNEVEWNCDAVTPGVYRCVIEVTLDSGTETAFTDIAVIR